MRIAVYAEVFVRPTETFIYETTTGLVASGHDVVVVADTRASAEDRPFEPVTLVSPPGRWAPNRLLRRVLRPLRGMPEGGEQAAIHRERLYRVLADARPDVILANYGPGGVLLAPVAERLGVPLVTSFHGFDASRYLRDPYWQARYALMFQTAAAVTGPSEYVRNRLIGAGCPPERARVLHYGIPTDRIRFAPPGQRFDGKSVEFLFVGRMTPKKDPITLLRSFALAREQMPELDARLSMLGDGPMRAEVEAAVEELGLGDAVRLRGRVAHDEVIAAFANAHIYVQHSVTAPDGDEEGLPVSITEALAGGLPVVATRHSGIPEVVRDGETGFIVEEGDAEGMAAAMVRMAREPSIWDEFGRTSRAMLEAEFAVPVIRAELQALLREVIEERRAAA